MCIYFKKSHASDDYMIFNYTCHKYIHQLIILHTIYSRILLKFMYCHFFLPPQLKTFSLDSIPSFLLLFILIQFKKCIDIFLYNPLKVQLENQFQKRETDLL